MKLMLQRIKDEHEKASMDLIKVIRRCTDNFRHHVYTKNNRITGEAAENSLAFNIILHGDSEVVDDVFDASFDVALVASNATSDKSVIQKAADVGGFTALYLWLSSL